ncbi:MAG: septum formation initiator family protein [Butyrivibrio sp.]|nr:septum formation initiator family protein [Butyrivibrio sp.]
MSSKRARYKRGSSLQNRVGIALSIVVVFLLLGVVSVKSISLVQKEKEYQSKEDALQLQIDSELERSDEIAEYEKYTQTRKYIEEVARQKLGLVYPGEIIFKDEDQGK